MRSLFILLVLSLTGTCLPLMAFDLKNSPLELEIESLKNSGKDYVGSYTLGSQQDDEFDIDLDDDESIYEYDYKSPKKAFVYSLLIPGWGQKYCESHAIKSLAFLAIEAGMWMGYFKYHNDGNKKSDEFEAFADEHWIEGPNTSAESYRNWLLGGDHDEDTMTHQIPELRDQQYYEMIGKYDQFRAGWDDYWDNPAWYDTQDANGVFIHVSPNRETYEFIRKDANDLLDRANKFVIISMVNHLISAFDAALAAKRYNRGKSSEFWLSIKAEMKKYSATEEIPIIRFAYKF